MKQRFVQFMSGIDTRRKGIVWFFATVLLFGASAYIYCIQTATLNGASWNTVEQEVGELRGSVSELESRYLSLKRGITLSVAYQNGFKDADSVAYITTKTLGAVVRNHDL